MPDLIMRTPTPQVDTAIAALADLGIDPERIELIPMGPLEQYKGGVVGQIPQPGEAVGEGVTVTLFVSRDGISERLPQEMLAPLPTAKNEAAIALEPGQTLDYWERQVRAYDSGRQLITVIDRALSRLDRALGRLLWSFSEVGGDDSFARALLEFVGLGHLPLSEREARLLASELQRWDQWVGPSGGVATILEQMLDIPVELVERRGPRLRIPREDCEPLGGSGARLGSVPLGPHFEDPAPELHLRLGPVGLARHAALDRDPLWHQKVEELLRIGCPAGSSWNYELVLERRDRALVLGDPLRSRLGRSSYLI